jgi:antitoxin component YwqK of YwqJK toxin-antitoxin module
MHILSTLLTFTYCFYLTAQPCVYESHQRKGGHYLFSTYFSTDMQTPLNGECEVKTNGILYEKRTFIKGRLTEEKLYHFGTKNLRVESYVWKKPNSDGTIATSKELYENGQAHFIRRFYLDSTNRRCCLTQEFLPNGKKRFEYIVGYVRLEEIDQSQRNGYPKHTVDEDGYLALDFLMGPHRTFDEEGNLASLVHYQKSEGDYVPVGQKEGTYFTYHKDGAVASSGYYLGGHANGTWKTFFPDGTVQSVMNYRNRLPDGEWKTWGENGMLLLDARYDIEGHYPFEPVYEAEWYADGRAKKWQEMNESGKGTLTEWNENGQLIHEVLFDKKGQQSKLAQQHYQLEKKWHPNGVLASLLNNTPNADTSYISWHTNGMLASSSIKFERDGFRFVANNEYTSKGLLTKSVTSGRNGLDTQFEMITYYVNGQMNTKIVQNNDIRLEEKYTLDGTKWQSVISKNGVCFGPCYFLDTITKIAEFGEYLDGIRHGTFQRLEGTSKELYKQNYTAGCPESNEFNAFELFDRLSKNQQEPYLATAQNQLLVALLNADNKEHYTFAYRDTIAAQIYVLDKEFKQHGNGMTLCEFEQFSIHCRLPEVYVQGLAQSDVNNPEVLRFLQTLDSLGWKAGKWVSKEGYLEGELFPNQLVGTGFLKTHFPKLGTFMSYSLSCGKVNEYDRFDHGAVQVEKESPCVWKMHYSFRGRSYVFLIYADDEVEFYNHHSNWKEFNEKENEPVFRMFKD